MNYGYDEGETMGKTVKVYLDEVALAHLETMKAIGCKPYPQVTMGEEKAYHKAESRLGYTLFRVAMRSGK